jgi:putative ABC transport system ATP-binding protein
MPPLIELKNVGYAAPSESGAFLLKNIDLCIEANEHWTILGPSGAGKSTLLRLLNRLSEPSEGRILIEGKEIQQIEVQSLRKRIGYVFQTPVFLRDLSLLDNLLYPLYWGRQDRQRDEEENRGLAEHLLSQVGLPKTVLERQPSEVSVGQAQRICLARTLANEPEVLLLDEPTSSLDPTARQEIERLIQGMREERRLAIVFVTHDIEQARRLGGNAAVLIEGRIADSGSAEQVFEHSKVQEVSAFLAGRLTRG